MYMYMPNNFWSCLLSQSFFIKLKGAIDSEILTQEIDPNNLHANVEYLSKGINCYLHMHENNVSINLQPHETCAIFYCNCVQN